MFVVSYTMAYCRQCHELMNHWKPCISKAGTQSDHSGQGKQHINVTSNKLGKLVTFYARQQYWQVLL